MADRPVVFFSLLVCFVIMAVPSVVAAPVNAGRTRNKIGLVSKLKFLVKEALKRCKIRNFETSAVTDENTSFRYEDSTPTLFEPFKTLQQTQRPGVILSIWRKHLGNQ